MLGQPSRFEPVTDITYPCQHRRDPWAEQVEPHDVAALLHLHAHRQDVASSLGCPLEAVPAMGASPAATATALAAMPAEALQHVQASAKAACLMAGL